jgi:GNAT superfamily N-acetyltransferase
VSCIPGLTSADLALGDVKSCDFDLEQVQMHWIQDSTDPWFERGYGILWNEFGSKNEMEQRTTLHKRLQWKPNELIHDYSFLYTMIVVTAGEEVVAVRDHTVILCHHIQDPLALVHLSHVWVDPAWRRTGLTGWLRALPIQTAREGLKQACLPSTSRIILAAEMEHYTQGNHDQWVRLKAYEKADYRKVDSDLIHYFQPDFRTAEEIDQSGGPQPIPMSLMLRLVGHEQQKEISSAEIKRIVFALYHMYGLEFRRQDMLHVYDSLSTYPADETLIDLVQPCRDIQP